MPLMREEHLRDSDHKHWISSSTSSCLETNQFSDLTFICGNQPFPSHQYMIGPRSPMLGRLFQMLNCCNCQAKPGGNYCGKKEELIVHVPDTQPKCLKLVLDVIYTGKASCLSQDQVNQVKECLRSLDIELKGLDFPVSGLRIDSVVSHARSTSEVFNRNGRSLTPAASQRNGEKRKMTPPLPPRIDNKRIKQEESPLQEMQLDMLQELKNSYAAGVEKSVQCKMPGCKEDVTFNQLTEHFKQHLVRENNVVENGMKKQEATRQMMKFSCIHCGKQFKFQKALDEHVKKYHQEKVTSEDSLKARISDSESDEDSTTEDFESENGDIAAPNHVQLNGNPQEKWKRAFGVPQPIQKKKETTGQRQGNPWRFPEISSPRDANKLSSLTASSNSMIHTSKSGSPEKSSAIKSTPPKDTVAINTFGCQKCANVFPEFKLMKTHYTYDHYWSKLTEQFGKWDRKCRICEKIYPTSDHLFHHMGNFHGSITVDRYLEAENFEVLTKEKTIKLETFNCELCKKEHTSSAALKSHLATKHFHPELAAEFSIGENKCKKCPKCNKLFESGGKSAVISHLGSYHDEVLKYALPYVKMDESDRVRIDVDDFEPGVEIIKISQPQSETNFLPICQHEGCKEEMKDREGLKIHYQQYHYNEQFKMNYSTKTCEFCNVTFEADWTLHRHIAINHEEVLINMLQKDGLALPSSSPKKIISPKKEKIERLSYSCSLCSQSFDYKNDLKEHYYSQHFSQDFDNIYTDSNCGLCYKKFNGVDKAQKHIALKHEHVLRSLLEKLGFSLPWNKAESRKGKNHRGSVFDYFASEPNDADLPCQKCTRQFKNVATLQAHYVQTHYWNYLSKSDGGCKFCASSCDSSDLQGFATHIIDQHERVLLELMGKESLFTGKSKQFELGGDIKLKKEGGYIRLKNIHCMNREAENTNSTEDILDKPCDMPGCVAYFSSEARNLHIYHKHLMEDHFWTDLQQEFGTSFLNDKERCPICKRINENGSELTYITHIAVDHAHVTKYVQKNVGKMAGPRNTRSELSPGPSTPEVLPPIFIKTLPEPVIIPTPSIMKIETSDNIIDSDEDADDPSYVPCGEEEEMAAQESATGELVEPKRTLQIKNIHTLIREDLLKKPEVPVPEKPEVKKDCICRSCGKSFDTPYKTQTHERNCTWKCTVCKTVFFKQSEFSAHVKSKECDSSNKGASSKHTKNKSEPEKVKQANAKTSNQGKWPCRQCKAVFFKQTEFSAHMPKCVPASTGASSKPTINKSQSENAKQENVKTPNQDPLAETSSEPTENRSEPEIAKQEDSKPSNQDPLANDDSDSDEELADDAIIQMLT